MKATIFDREEDGDQRWSKLAFGSQWDSALCYGRVVRVYEKAKVATIRWEIDNTLTALSTSVLTLVNESRTLASTHRSLPTMALL